jgi:hypothetical protein
VRRTVQMHHRQQDDVLQGPEKFAAIHRI